MPQEQHKLKNVQKPREENVVPTDATEEQRKQDELLEQQSKHEQELLQKQQWKDDAALILRQAKHDYELHDLVNQYKDLDAWQIMQDTKAEIVWKEKERASQDILDLELANGKEDKDTRDKRPANELLLEQVNNRSANLAEVEKEEEKPSVKEVVDLETYIRANEVHESRLNAIEENKEQKPWLAVLNVNYEQALPQDNSNEQQKEVQEEVVHPIQKSYERHQNLEEPSDRLALSYYEHREQKVGLEPDIGHGNEEKSFSCNVPYEVGSKLAELGPLEPETMKYLHEQYGYIERHVVLPQSREEHVQGFAQAAEHAQESFKSARDEICPERHERAQLQIEQLETLKGETKPVYLQEQLEITYQPNEKNACYEMKNAAATDWEKTQLPPTLQKVLEQREDLEAKEKVEELEKALELAERQQKEHNRQLDSRRAILVNEDKIKQHENEIDHIRDEEPAPMTIYTFRGGYLCRVYEAHNLEEFDRYDADCPPTPDCLAAILDLDRRWKLWRGRVEREELELNNARSNTYSIEYEHDEYDR